MSFRIMSALTVPSPSWLVTCTSTQPKRAPELAVILKFQHKFLGFKNNRNETIPIDPWSEQSPVLPPGACAGLLLHPLDPDPCPGHGLSLGVKHEAPDPAIHRGQERDHGAIVRPPLATEAPGRRPLLTTDLHCELETVCVEVSEVLETSRDYLEVVAAIISDCDWVRMTRTVAEMISSMVVLKLCLAKLLTLCT